MSSRKALNTTDSPVVIDTDGHQIDGKSAGQVDPEQPFVAAALATGALILATEATEPAEPAGQPSAEQLTRAEEVLDPPADDTPARRRQTGGQKERS